ncbi:MAG: DNA primase, partial [archaeon]|nr:DNA primase [archaeon]
KVLRAPQGKEVEDLTPLEILEILKGETQIKPVEEVPTYLEGLSEKVKESFPSINGTLEAIILDEKFDQMLRVPVNELVQRLESLEGAKYLIFDGIITQRLIDSASKTGIISIVGHRMGEITKKQDILLKTFDEFELE